METNEHSTHPLVEKAAHKWLELATKHGVRATLERGDNWCEPTAVAVKIHTGDPFEHCTIVICPPTRAGRRPRQVPVLSRYYRSKGRQLKYGVKPGTTLRDAQLWLARSARANHTQAVNA